MSEPRVSAPSLRGTGMVLVVDDYSPAREMIAYLLGCYGYEVKMAGDGPGALQLAAETPFDLVVLDVEMPDISGVELCQKLRDHWRREVPVVFISGGSGPLQQAARQVPRSGFFSKPLECGDFLEAVQRLLSGA
ncbi:response regulator [Oleiharenicola lentus]|uniref:response regulator n=1 Tax=Oleiharenicola lentus TaxID=2508720 RepID=UPI003F66191A